MWRPISVTSMFVIDIHVSNITAGSAFTKMSGSWRPILPVYSQIYLYFFTSYFINRKTWRLGGMRYKSYHMTWASLSICFLELPKAFNPESSQSQKHSFVFIQKQKSLSRKSGSIPFGLKKFCQFSASKRLSKNLRLDLIGHFYWKDRSLILNCRLLMWNSYREVCVWNHSSKLK